MCSCRATSFSLPCPITVEKRLGMSHDVGLLTSEKPSILVRTQRKRSRRSRTQDKRSLLGQKHYTFYLSWISFCWQYYTIIIVPSWANNASRPDGIVLSSFPLEGHFCSIYSYSIFVYASLLYRLPESWEKHTAVSADLLEEGNYISISFLAFLASLLYGLLMYSHGLCFDLCTIC